MKFIFSQFFFYLEEINPNFLVSFIKRRVVYDFLFSSGIYVNIIHFHFLCMILIVLSIASFFASHSSS